MPTAYGNLPQLLAAGPFLRDGAFLFTAKPAGLIARGIEYWTGWPETHVAVLLSDPATGVQWVYEGYPPRARKMKLAQHLDHLEKLENRWIVRRNGGLSPVWVQPPWTASELVLMRQRAEELLGTPYRLVWNYFRGNDRAMHCSEYAGAVADATGRIDYEGHRETPGGLMRKLQSLEWDS